MNALLTPQKCTVQFWHGLGDTVYFAHQLPLYTRQGWSLEVHCYADRREIFAATGVALDSREDASAKVAWAHPPPAEAGVVPPVWLANKAAVNLGRAPMPPLSGTPEELWREFCAVELNVAPHIRSEAWCEVERFLATLRPPVVLVHTVGNSLRHLKSLTPEVTLDLYRHLLDGMDGTLLLLDWDNRVPRLASHRVRHLTDDWKRIDVAHLLALLTKSNLLVGVDSGPLHACRLTGTPAVGVFPKTQHYPSRYLLPRAGQVVVVPQSGSGHPNRVHRDAFHIIEAREPVVSGEFIARQALRLLGGNRYLPMPHRAADVQLRHFVEDLERGGPGALSARVDRDASFDLLFREIAVRFPQPLIVETGCVRAEEDWGGAGFSTVLLGSLVQRLGGRLISVDLDAGHCAFARRATEEFDRVEVVQADSVAFLRDFTGRIDVLLLDSLDTTDPRSTEHGLAEIQAALPHLHARSLVVFDDTVYQARKFHGKGALAVPWLLERGWRLKYSGYQTVLSYA